MKQLPIPATAGLHIRSTTVPDVERIEPTEWDLDDQVLTRHQVLSYEAALRQDGITMLMEQRLNAKIVVIVGPPTSGKTATADALLARNDDFRPSVQLTAYRIPPYGTIQRITNRRPRSDEGNSPYYQFATTRSISRRLYYDRNRPRPRIYEAHTFSGYGYLLYLEMIEAAVAEERLIVLPASLETARALKMLFPALHICLFFPHWWLEETENHLSHRARTLRPEWTRGIEEWRFDYVRVLFNLANDRVYGHPAVDSIYVPPRFSYEELRDIAWRKLIAEPAATDVMEIFYGLLGRTPPGTVEGHVDRAFADLGRLKANYQRFVQEHDAEIDWLAPRINLYERMVDPVNAIREDWPLPHYQFISPGRRLLPVPYKHILPGG